ncbi:MULTISPECIES: amylo-alpha-1,6-glucosidase [unclassified Chelatococcus]|uniref:amylo-alpha-1,6-glucosidase n=1 Tax=unclassified Chelatococcus TaxID=2638111 RepID=UPI001BCE6E87|nr:MULTISPECIES: amylo-alpha-1,6-glucosidase [unclassified Chelatococcus]CAH1670624.1 Glycogen debranching enzyme [Hyphomicrobiales bacterium]MBS7739179.1 amylo-alpha-1,6-glucosidase [Chelatococcus sp. HY11]MBX3543669.1 amylo-alpha-1,6-glucosidase [Chelatococcus sp.]MCO5076288.1 amylo-alpha-1,6-glucosidase [Chelatococcus sp.]CAH1677181.1 Glycogen debranching enzyme [Hyphomicrobiales bacterium]
MQTRTAEIAAHASAPLNVGDAPLAQFFIPAAASLQERRPRTLKHGDTFAVFDHNGDALAGPGSPEGVYHRDTRHLSHFFLTMGGVRPMLLSSTLRDDNASLTCDLTNPDLYDDTGRLVLGHDLIHVRRSRFLWNGACFERLSVRNFDERHRKVRIEIAFAADFADIFEVRGTRRGRRGHDHPAEITPRSVTLAYTGLDARRRDTSLHFDPAPVVLTSSLAVFEFSLAPREAQLAFIEILCDGGRHRGGQAAGEASAGHHDTRRAFFMALRDARRSLRISSSRAATVATSNEICNEAVRRSVSDLYMLVTDTPEGPFPYAGIPWFSTVFGRDALITALEMLWLDPNVARGVLCHLAANQATRHDPVADAEPGKILHELRQGEMAELGEVPFRRYYGSVDSTPLFVMLAGAYFERTGDLGIMTKLWPHIDAALKWIETDGDRDGDGFVEYGRRTADGLINQGWKDSHDSIFHADGTLASGPIALVEVQAYVYGAWQAAARVARALGYGRRAQEFNDKARMLRMRFDESFFDEELSTYVLALDGHKSPCRVRASNAGHALFTGIALPERAPLVVETLMARSSFSGWGVRTVASTEARYNPMSYHNGSVWPHDNAIVAAGFARYGFRAQAARIFEGLFSTSLYIDHRRLPELFCGFPRQRSRGPTFYPVACIPQAWAAAAPLSLIQSCLGLGFNMDERETVFDEPALPDFLDEVTLRRLAVGEGSVDVALRRAGHQVVVNVLSRRGDVRVLTRS